MIPSSGRIIFEAEPEATERGGVILVKELRENIKGVVINIGDGVDEINVGDKVVMNRGHARLIEGNIYSALANPDRVLVYG